MRLPPLSRCADSPFPAAAERANGAPEVTCAWLCASLRRAAAQRSMLDVVAVCRAVRELGGAGTPGLRALVQVLHAWSAVRRLPGGAAVAEDFAAHGQLATIDAIAHAARDNQDALAEAYQNADDDAVRDSLCEAAAKVVDAGPALFALMVAHLDVDPFVAGLSLADHGDPAALPQLLQHLAREVDAAAAAASGPQPEKSSGRALRVDGLVEAIEALGGRVPLALEQGVAHALAPGRAALAPWLELAPPGGGVLPPTPRGSPWRAAKS